ERDPYRQVAFESRHDSIAIHECQGAPVPYARRSTGTAWGWRSGALGDVAGCLLQGEPVELVHRQAHQQLDTPAQNAKHVLDDAARLVGIVHVARRVLDAPMRGHRLS